MNAYEMAMELIIGSRLKRLSDRFFSDVSQVYKSVNIPFETAYFPVFYLLDRRGTLTVSHVARELEITQSGASQMIHSLVKKGLVRYLKNKDDKRVRAVTFTPEGTKLLLRVKPVWKTIRKCFRDLLNEGENSRFFIEALNEVEESISDKNLFLRVSGELKKRNILENIVFLPYEDRLEAEFKDLSLCWLLENGCAETGDTDFINRTARMIEEGKGTAETATAGSEVVGAYCLSIKQNAAEIMVFGIKEPWRHLGLEEAMLARLACKLRQMGIPRVSVKVDRRLGALVKQFKNAGFVLSSLKTEKDGMPGFILDKEIVSDDNPKELAPSV